MAQYEVVIIGSGINALVCAAILAKRGRKVCVLERNDRLGGCIRTEALTAPGYTHDVLSGWHPLFVTSPGYAELKSDLERYGLQYCNTDSPTGAVLPDDRHFILRRDRGANAAALNALAAGDGDRYREALAALEQRLDLTFTLLGGELWSWPTAKVLLSALWKRGVHDLAQYFGAGLENCRDWLERDLHGAGAQACFAPWPRHAGLSPDSPASALMAQIIAFTLEAAGMPVVRGGSNQLVEAFRQLITAYGGELHVNADVVSVQTGAGRARAARTADGREFDASVAVVASVTPRALYEGLLRDASVPQAVRAQARAFKHGLADMQIHLALSEPPRWCDPELGKVAMLHLTPGLNGVCQATGEAERGLLPAQSTIAVGQPTAVDPSRAPEGKAILWLQLQELPSRLRGDAAGTIPIPADGAWTVDVRERYADRIMARLGRHIPNLESALIQRVVVSPADLEAYNCNLVGGDPYGGACSLDQFFLWRPLRAVRGHKTPIPGLYHIGASTHPGPGLGGGSGFLVAQALTA